MTDEEEPRGFRGVLEKKNRTGKWQERWVEIRGSTLFYWHEEPADLSIAPKGAVALADVDVVPADAMGDSFEFALEPKARGKNLQLRATSGAQAHTWVVELASAQEEAGLASHIEVSPVKAS
jgi:hypothetical protein